MGLRTRQARRCGIRWVGRAYCASLSVCMFHTHVPGCVCRVPSSQLIAFVALTGSKAAPHCQGPLWHPLWSPVLSLCLLLLCQSHCDGG